MSKEEGRHDGTPGQTPEATEAIVDPIIDPIMPAFRAWLGARQKLFMVYRAVFGAMARNKRGKNAPAALLYDYLISRSVRGHFDVKIGGVGWIRLHRSSLLHYGIRPRQMDRLLCELAGGSVEDPRIPLIFRRKEPVKRSPTNHVRINWPVSLAEWEWCKSVIEIDEHFDFSEKSIADALKSPELPNPLILGVQKRPIHPSFFLDSPERKGELSIAEKGAAVPDSGGERAEKGAAVPDSGNCFDSESFTRSQSSSPSSAHAAAAAIMEPTPPNDDDSAARVNGPEKAGEDWERAVCDLVKIGVTEGRVRRWLSTGKRTEEELAQILAWCRANKQGRVKDFAAYVANAIDLGIGLPTEDDLRSDRAAALDADRRREANERQAQEREERRRRRETVLAELLPIYAALSEQEREAIDKELRQQSFYASLLADPKRMENLATRVNVMEARLDILAKRRGIALPREGETKP